MVSIRESNTKGRSGPKIELGCHFGTPSLMTDFFTFLVPKKYLGGSKRVLDKSFKLK